MQLSVRIDVAELIPEANLNPITLACIMLLSMIQDSLANLRLDRIGDMVQPNHVDRD